MFAANVVHANTINTKPGCHHRYLFRPTAKP